MRNSVCGTLGVLALLACLLPLRAGATDPGPELAFMRHSMNQVSSMLMERCTFFPPPVQLNRRFTVLFDLPQFRSHHYKECAEIPNQATGAA